VFWSSTKQISSHRPVACSRHVIVEKIARLALNNNHLLDYSQTWSLTNVHRYQIPFTIFIVNTLISFYITTTLYTCIFLVFYLSPGVYLPTYVGIFLVFYLSSGRYLPTYVGIRFPLLHSYLTRWSYSILLPPLHVYLSCVPPLPWGILTNINRYVSCVLPLPRGILTNICRYQIPVITFIFNTLVLFYGGTVLNTLIIHVPTTWIKKKYRNYKKYTKRTFWSNM